MNIEEIKKYQWTKYWADTRSMMFAWYCGNYYTQLMSSYFGVGFSRAVITAKHGRSACYFTLEDRKVVGNYLVTQVLANADWLPQYCGLIKKKADALINFSLAKRTAIDQATFEEFLELLHTYIAWHISPRHIIDFLPPDKAQENLLLLQEVRLYTEPVYKEADNFIQKWASEQGELNGYSAELLLCCTGKEVEAFWNSHVLPNSETLKERYENAALLFEAKSPSMLITGSSAESAGNVLVEVKYDNQIKGAVAYKGKVSGRVRIIHDPAKVEIFEEGDILVTGMTRPDFLTLMKKAGAMVTDSGGLLCHAAITAREFKIPCIIGTETATRFLKDGDMVEVDAEKGMVRKI